ncbi:hypothetical protein [Mycobacterium lepromatosis]|uniref:hypothetical protein n=1 Tax=Mycobacterium lepromatosis TaxID=480418 RepID=UPI0005F86688|nr:hypothetical protein [Mycobacterium lepromatosis]
MASVRTYEVLATYLAASVVGDITPLPFVTQVLYVIDFPPRYRVDIRTHQGRCRDRAVLGTRIARADVSDYSDTHDLLRADGDSDPALLRAASWEDG